MSKKSAKQKQFPSKEKKPKNQKSPHKTKAVKSVQNPDSIMKQRPVWKFGSLDLEFPWGFSIQGGKKDFDNVVRKLKDFEKLSWAEIYTNKKWNHPISISKISKQAKRRLEKLNIDANDQGSLYQLRISQKERLFGIRESEVFYVLWWDPNHEVCPSEKRHT